MTLPNFLTTQSGDISAQYKALSPDEKDTLLSEHLQAKEKEIMPKRVSHAAVSKAVYSQMGLISETVRVCITSSTCF
jgi:hypothetical protein